MSKNKSIIASSFISQEVVERKIYLIRGRKVMIDQDLASLYQVATKVLNQAVKRNIKRFPPDFMFRLNQAEKKEVVTHCDHLQRNSGDTILNSFQPRQLLNSLHT